MLIISRLAVLPHKHPHELLDSVVKERAVDPFVSTEARVLQQPHLPSSYFSKFFPKKFFLLNHLRFRSTCSFSSAGGEFYSVSNRCQPPLLPLSIISTEPLQTQTHHPEEEAHSTQLSLLCNPLFKYNFLFYKKFKEPQTPEEVRIIGTTKRRSIDCYAFVSTSTKPRAVATQSNNASPTETTKPLKLTLQRLCRNNHASVQSITRP